MGGTSAVSASREIGFNARILYEIVTFITWCLNRSLKRKLVCIDYFTSEDEIVACASMK